jgi:hypothetical protein
VLTAARGAALRLLAAAFVVPVSVAPGRSDVIGGSVVSRMIDVTGVSLEDSVRLRLVRVLWIRAPVGRCAAPRAGEGAVEVPSARVAVVHDAGRLGSTVVTFLGPAVKVVWDPPIPARRLE